MLTRSFYVYNLSPEFISLENWLLKQIHLGPGPLDFFPIVLHTNIKEKKRVSKVLLEKNLQTAINVAKKMSL